MYFQMSLVDGALDWQVKADEYGAEWLLLVRPSNQRWACATLGLTFIHEHEQ